MQESSTPMTPQEMAYAGIQKDARIAMQTAHARIDTSIVVLTKTMPAVTSIPYVSLTTLEQTVTTRLCMPIDIFHRPLRIQHHPGQ